MELWPTFGTAKMVNSWEFMSLELRLTIYIPREFLVKDPVNYSRTLPMVRRSHQLVRYHAKYNTLKR